MIFDYEVLAFLCIDERSNVGVAGGDDRLCISEAVLLSIFSMEPSGRGVILSIMVHGKLTFSGFCR